MASPWVEDDEPDWSETAPLQDEGPVESLIVV